MAITQIYELRFVYIRYVKLTQFLTLLLVLVLIFPAVCAAFDVISGTNDQYELSENPDEEESNDGTDNEKEEESSDEVEEFTINDLLLLTELDTRSTNTFVHQQNLYSINRELSTPPPRIS